MNPAVSRTDLMVLSRISWDEIVLPIVNTLGHVLKLKRHSRIWLYPTAAFTFILLRAVHPSKTNPDRSEEPCLEDLYICSYTSTLSALVRTRHIMKRVSPSFVMIGPSQLDAKCSWVLTARSSLSEARPCDSRPYHYFWRRSHASKCTPSI